MNNLYEGQFLVRVGVPERIIKILKLHPKDKQAQVKYVRASHPSNVGMEGRLFTRSIGWMYEPLEKDPTKPSWEV